MKLTYDGIDIEYDEKRNVWVFELRGRERSSESLAKAKEAIDKPAPTPKEEKTFVRCKAFLKESYGDKFEPVEVTSIAQDDSYRGSVYLWVVRNGARRKESSYFIYADTPENAVKIGQYVAAMKEAERQREIARNIESKMEHIKVQP